MTKVKGYYEQNLPFLILRLKSQVKKNMDIINSEVESGIGAEKYLNVLKGKRMAVDYSISTLNRIDKLENDNSSYKKIILPELITRIKEMVDVNLKVIDIDIEEEDNTVEKLENVKEELNEIFGKELVKTILKNAYKNGSLSEDKYILVIKARDMAGIDTEWAMSKIDELIGEMNDKTKINNRPKKSWSKRAAEKRV